jgi:hypothetical protein
MVTVGEETTNGDSFQADRGRVVVDTSSWFGGDGVVACRSLCSRIARPRKGLDRRAHGESWQATPPLKGWKEKEQSARSKGRSGGTNQPMTLGEYGEGKAVLSDHAHLGGYPSPSLMH